MRVIQLICVGHDIELDLQTRYENLARLTHAWRELAMAPTSVMIRLR